MSAQAVKRVLLAIGVVASLLGNGSSFSFRQPLHQPSSSHVIVPTTMTIGTADTKSMMGHEMMEDSEAAHQTISKEITPRRRTAAALAAATATTTLALMLAVSVPTAHADEYGRESEAPLAYTGETVEICTKRGPLGACTKTQARTAENDNDKSDMYFRPPSDLVKRKDVEARTAEITEGNALIDRLKQQTEDNREKNELAVRQRTMVNDSVCVVALTVALAVLCDAVLKE